MWSGLQVYFTSGGVRAVNNQLLMQREEENTVVTFAFPSADAKPHYLMHSTSFYNEIFEILIN